ncbi:MAG TPA: hypothetical protein VLK36_15770 [Gaiellaceae bacterium]|nr:hypothetical protein [Gaiellaceae bacterium]
MGATSRAAALLLTSAAENAGGAVYGAVMVGVLLAAEDARHEGYGATIEATLVVLALYWLTSLYTQTLGIRMRRREPMNVELLWRSCIHELPVLEGGLLPVVTLLVAWAAGFAVTSAATAGLWAAAVSVVLLELAVGWRSRQRRIWLQAIVGVSIGLALIALKLVLH